MPKITSAFAKFVLLLLISTLILGVLSSWAYLYPRHFNDRLPFYQLRPIHTSSALFFIISGAVLCIISFSKAALGSDINSTTLRVYIASWIVIIIVVFIYYSLKKFGGREYWVFPGWLALPLLISWSFLMVSYFVNWFKSDKKKPLYIWMWSTGIFFFFLTFIEQNLWQIPWFRQSFIRELTVQWKANGSMVGAWNQMIYGTSLFIMVKISGDENIARNKKAFFFYFLGLTNLMFNWGHHIYNLPTNSWIRHVSYIISMTEWLILISIIRGFKSKLEESRKLKHLISYRFLLAAEFWVFANLILALLMSIPAINHYTHGTHITVAHAMGTTIGINVMILLGAIGYHLKIDRISRSRNRVLMLSFLTVQASLFIFWSSLIVAGLLKGYRSAVLDISIFQEVMKPVNEMLKVFAIAGISLAAGMTIIVSIYWQQINKCRIDVNELNKR